MKQKYLDRKTRSAKKKEEAAKLYEGAIQKIGKDALLDKDERSKILSAARKIFSRSAAIISKSLTA